MTDPRTLLRAVGPEGSGRIESWGYHDGRFCLILPDGTFRLATHGNLESTLNDLPEPKPRKAASRRVPVAGVPSPVVRSEGQSRPSGRGTPKTPQGGNV